MLLENLPDQLEKMIRSLSHLTEQQLNRPVKELSESEILDAFIPVIEQHNSWVTNGNLDQPLSTQMVVGPGDDCAVLEVPACQLVLTTDTLTESFDFRRKWNSGDDTGGYDIGWKVATQNLADVVSMGATPTTLLVSLSLPSTLTLQWVVDFAVGITASCKANGASFCTIAGGDLGSSTEISVTVTAIGQCLHKPLLRTGAKDGDVVAIAGELGTAAAGLDVLETLAPNSVQGLSERPAEINRMVRAQQRPQTPLTAALAAASLAHSMMDISDGLVKDAERMAKASGLSFHLKSAKLVKDSSELESVARWLGFEKPQQIALNWVLSGGENHGMLACFDSDQQLPPGFRPIGVCRASTPGKVFVDGKAPEVSGWDHFIVS